MKDMKKTNTFGTLDEMSSEKRTQAFRAHEARGLITGDSRLHDLGTDLRSCLSTHLARFAKK